MELILGFILALCLIGIIYLGTFYGIYITEKTNKNKLKNEVEDGKID